MNDTHPDDPAASPASVEPSLEGFRDEFPILRRKVYLNSNSLGALSRRAMAEGKEFERLWNELGASAWYDIWWSKLDEVRAGFGATIGAPPGTIALMPSVSACLAAVSGALAADPTESRRRIVTTELDFPTLGHHFASRGALGYELTIVESPDGVTVPLEAIREAVGPDTLLVATSHVLYTTGAIQDARALAEIVHDEGAYIFLDAYQSNGQLPIDISSLGVDFLASGALKWLCGGPGLAYLYVRPDLDLLPTTLSWFGVENPFDFDIRAASPRSDARRFELGTPAAGAAYTAAGALSIILEAGIERIRQRNRSLADDLRARLEEEGWALHQPTDPEVRSALVLIEHPDAPGAVECLAERDVIVDARGPLLRFSPHFYNTVEDNRRAVEALREVS